MKKILLPALLAAMTLFGASGLVNASSGNVDANAPVTTAAGKPKPKPYPPDTVAVEAPTVPPLVVPPVASLPTTGSDSSSMLTGGAVALGVGGGLVLVARSRRRRPQPTV